MLWTITAASFASAAVMTLVAWRAVRAERPRAVAGPAGLEDDARADRDSRGDDGSPLVAPEARPSRSAAAIALAVFAVGSGAALAVVLSGPASSPRGTTVAAAQPGAPIELVALGHEREGDTLAIHGVVRNPPAGVAVSDLTAVVFLFGRDGTFLTSAQAAVDTGDLAPGADARFNIVIPSALDVARYRVSFRTDRGIMAHVDRRDAGGSR